MIDACRYRSGLLCMFLLGSALRVGFAEEPKPVSEAEWTPVPFRVRNLTFPTVLTMGFMPRPTNPAGAGAWVVEINASASNNFQMSTGIQDWLAQRGGPRRPLSSDDIAAIVAGLDEPQFLVDGELGVVDLGIHYGLSPRLTASLRIGHLGYSGGFMDPFIQGFHDLAGIGQAGREFLGKGDFQMLFIHDGDHVALVDRPSSGGLTDPMLSLAYSFPEQCKNWSFSVEGAVKPPISDENDWISTGSWDVGVQATAQKTWRRNALVLNLSLVLPGDVRIKGNFDPPELPSLNVAYLVRLGNRTTGVIQALYSENIFRDEIDSELSAYEFQVTAGVKIEAFGGGIGLAITENLINFDNTPDFGLHLSYGILIR